MHQGSGGNVTLLPGSGEPDGSIVFCLAGESEYLRIDSDGRAYVQGRFVAEDYLVYAAFRHWLSMAGIRPPPPVADEPSAVVPVSQD